MTKDEMKNRISMALKDPILQQGFEVICKENAELEKEKCELLGIIQGKDKTIKDLKWQLQEVLQDNNSYQADNEKLEKENAELKAKAEAKHSCPNCVSFGRHCPHKVNGDPYFYDCYLTVVELEKENEELKEINEGYCRSRDRLISMGFPTFKDCKEYAEHLTKAKEIIQTLSTCLEGHHTNSFEYEQIKQAEAFLSEVEE